MQCLRGFAISKNINDEDTRYLKDWRLVSG